MFFSVYYLLALILILTVHEAAHAWVAVRLGDPTAERAGRLSLNPLRHIDVVGTLMLFFAGIGWGKPVPINPKNFKRPHWDEAMTAVAGPLANLALAVLAAIPFTYLPEGFEGLRDFSYAVMELSIVLFLFNMLPFPPLDGSKFIAIFVPADRREKYMRFLSKSTPYFIVFVVVDIYFFGQLFGFSLISKVVSTATYWLKTAILVLV